MDFLSKQMSLNTCFGGLLWRTAELRDWSSLSIPWAAVEPSGLRPIWRIIGLRKDGRSPSSHWRRKVLISTHCILRSSELLLTWQVKAGPLEQRCGKTYDV